MSMMSILCATRFLTLSGLGTGGTRRRAAGQVLHHPPPRALLQGSLQYARKLGVSSHRGRPVLLPTAGWPFSCSTFSLEGASGLSKHKPIRAARPAPAADHNSASTTVAAGENAAGGASGPRGNWSRKGQPASWRGGDAGRRVYAPRAHARPGLRDSLSNKEFGESRKPGGRTRSTRRSGCAARSLQTPAPPLPAGGQYLRRRRPRG